MARSKELVPGVGRFSRSQVYSNRGLWKGVKKSEKQAPQTTPEYVEKSIGGDKNGGKRLVPTKKAPRFYPAEDVRKPKKSRKTHHPPSLRSSITPGTILILLAGRFRGKRVVFLKQLASGLLLITGPYKINGVPLRRVNQSYVIATSTKVDISGLTVIFSLLPRLFNLIFLSIVSLMRSTTTDISQSPQTKAPNQQKRNSSKMASLSPRKLFPSQKLQTRRPSTVPLLLPLKGLRTLPSISKPLGVFQRDSSLTSCYFNHLRLFGCLGIFYIMRCP